MEVASIVRNFLLLAFLAACITGSDADVVEDFDEFGEGDSGTGSVASEGTWTIYMAPKTGWTVNGVPVAGVDSHPGTPEYPVRTLNGAQRVAQELIASGEPLRDIEVRIAPGLYDYVNQHVEWTTVMADHTITFLPWVGNQRPVFDGSATKLPCSTNNSTCARPEYYSGVSFFKLALPAGTKSNIVMRYLKIQNYANAIALRGASRTHLYGMYFYRIGNLYQPNMVATTSAVSISNGATHNTIVNSHFVDIANLSSPDFAYGPGDIHAVYIAYRGKRNRIERSRFQNVSGDPIRIRDDSHENYIEDNTFHEAGLNAMASHWQGASDCPSFYTRFKRNVIDGLWQCRAYHVETVNGFRGWPVRFPSAEDRPEGCETPPAQPGDALPLQHWSLSSNTIAHDSCP